MLPPQGAPAARGSRAALSWSVEAQQRLLRTIERIESRRCDAHLTMEAVQGGRLFRNDQVQVLRLDGTTQRPEDEASSLKSVKTLKPLTVLPELQTSVPAFAAKSSNVGTALSPLKFELPSTPELKSLWYRSTAAYRRLCMQQQAKRAMALNRRKCHGLDVPVPESPETRAGSSE